MHKNTKSAILVAACGLAASMTQVAMAQPFLVNVHGATLLQRLLEAPAVTNDYLDVDSDGNATRLNNNPDQQALALVATPSAGYIPTTQWVVQYRAVGSVNGLQELVSWGGQRLTPPYAAFSTGDQFQIDLLATAANPARANRFRYINAGAADGVYFNGSNPGGAPFRSSTDSLYTVQAFTTPGTPSTGGIQVDVAPIDVPSIWGVTVAGTATWNDTPTAMGYGTNANNSKNRQGGTSGANLSNRLVDLPTGFKIYDGVPANANGQTIFDTTFTFAPIVPFANFGTGISQLNYTQLQHLYVTGRLPSGENLTAITRDVGSGTHNGFMNSIGVDPSWGVGENVGPVNQGTTNQQLGDVYWPGNKGSTGSLNGTIRNTRLGVGYIGGDSWASNSAWNYADIIAVRNDLNGRTVGNFVRPTVATILDNGLIGESDIGTANTNTSDGFRIGGLAVFSTLGDPRQVPAVDGGYGFISGETNPGTPAMLNRNAAEFVNNLSRSVDAFNSLPGSDQTVFSPGEFVAANFFPVPCIDYVPTLLDGTVYAANAQRTTTLQEFERTNPLSIYITSATRYASYGTAGLNGQAPTRKPNPTFPYSDGVSGADPDFLEQDGGSVNQGATLTSSRNRIAGDFNGDGLRNVEDAAAMVAAWRQRNGGPAWVAADGTGAIAGSLGVDACIEILGDFSGDGNFGRIFTSATVFVADRTDVRYWADGLAIAVTGPNAGKLDRAAGFTAVDAAFAGNFFGTTLATPKAYANGDSRGDVANSAGTITKGFIPIGADGNGDGVTSNDNRIDAFDIDYVCAQIRTAADGEVNWDNLSEASVADLSADINGDLRINGADLTELVTVVLGTVIGDVNLDGTKDAADLAIITANLNTAGGWARGDLNCDGLVNQADVDIFGGGGTPVCDSIDFNNDGLTPDSGDLDDFIAVLAGGPSACSTFPTPGCNDLDFNNDGLFPDALDLDAFISRLAGGPCLQ
jgi:hypothetical protein